MRKFALYFLSSPRRVREKKRGRKKEREREVEVDCGRRKIQIIKENKLIIDKKMTYNKYVKETNNMFREK